jgi:hypothetical protein
MRLHRLSGLRCVERSKDVSLILLFSVVDRVCSRKKVIKVHCLVCASVCLRLS